MFHLIYTDICISVDNKIKQAVDSRHFVHEGVYSCFTFVIILTYGCLYAVTIRYLFKLTLTINIKINMLILDLLTLINRVLISWESCLYHLSHSGPA